MISLPYGRGALHWGAPVSPAVLLRAAGPPAAGRAEGLPTDPVLALAHPTDGSPPLAELVSRGEPVTVVVSDLTRSWVPTARMVEAIGQALASRGVPDRAVTVLVATGTHRSHTPDELVSLVGPEARARYKIVDHRCSGPDLVDRGVTSRGTPVALNRLLEDSQVILTGGVSFHLMCGFGGGRKSVCPGAAGYDTIQANHRLVLSHPPGMGPGELEGNLMHEDLLEIAGLVQPIFLVNALPSAGDSPTRFVSGHWREAWLQGCENLRREFAVVPEAPAELVLASAGGYPHDLNLYQTVKAIVNVQKGVRPGGALVMASECSEGLGEVRDFGATLEMGLEAARRQLSQRFTVPAYAAYRLLEAASELAVVLVSSLPPETVRRAGLIPAGSLDEALTLACSRLPSNPATYVVLEAGSTLLASGVQRAATPAAS